jgi:hypothetical protein
MRKARISGPFSSLLGSLGKRTTAWLTWEDSNLNIPDREMPFEMSREFPHFSSKSRSGDFCSSKVHIQRLRGL